MLRETEPRRLPDLRRPQTIALVVGLVGVVLCVIGAITDPVQFFRSYLAGWFFWVTITVGCLLILMMQYLTGGNWGATTRRVLEAGAMAVPLLAILFIPLIFGLSDLYSWARPEAVAADATLQHQSPYLNIPFFLIRTLFYFICWIALAYFLTRLSVKQDRTGDLDLRGPLQGLSAGGLLLLGLTATFAEVDWVMSLEPHWYSTIYGAMVTVAGILAAFGLAVLMVTLLRERPLLQAILTPRLLNDMGSLMLAFVIFWAYLSFSQFLVVWSGNTFEEIPWYVRRFNGGWQWLIIAAVIGNWAIPFFMLLFRGVKRNPPVIGAVSALLIITHYVNVFWLVSPGARGPVFYLSWQDLAVLLGVSGLWVAVFIWQLRGRPLVPIRSPQYPLLGELEHGRG